jgi:hypothetical protein
VLLWACCLAIWAYMIVAPRELISEKIQKAREASAPADFVVGTSSYLTKASRQRWSLGASGRCASSVVSTVMVLMQPHHRLAPY